MVRDEGIQRVICPVVVCLLLPKPALEKLQPLLCFWWFSKWQRCKYSARREGRQKLRDILNRFTFDVKIVKV